MKKQVLLIGGILMVFSLTAFVFKNIGNPEMPDTEVSCKKTTPFPIPFQVSTIDFADNDFTLGIGSRFNTRITKADLLESKTILDIIPDRDDIMRSEFKNSRVSILHSSGEETVSGTNEVLNPDQLALLEKAKYSSNLRLTSIYKRTELFSGMSYEDSLVYYITVVPEKLAESEIGKEAFIQYIDKKSREMTAMAESYKLKPGKLVFNVSKTGEIDKTGILSTSGYEDIDIRMVEILQESPYSWIPAENAEGEKVDQQLVLFYGLIGC